MLMNATVPARSEDPEKAASGNLTDAPTSGRLARWAVFLDRQKDRMGTLQAVVTICAIFIGGTWTYLAFIQQRQSHPRLKIEYQVNHWKLSNAQTLLSVTEILTNTGPVLLKLREGEIRVIQVMPLPSRVAGELPALLTKPTHAKAEGSIFDPKLWNVLVDAPRSWNEGDKIIEPGESDVVPNEFILPANLQVIAVYSFIKNPEDKNVGWNGVTYYSFENSPNDKEPDVATARPSHRPRHPMDPAH